ncbi:MAG: hypothetical protein GX594_11095, partial [Pirellulaceae bacterium]|nr:hypothetical protein [Pirellulaceae bacterium]
MFPQLLLAFLTIAFEADAGFDDARLNDVCFVGVENGWAVGDRGTILHSDDGGKNWRPQTSGVDCSLWSVCFIDPQHGWAAGGLTHPFTHASSGVVLTTSDGGQTWKRNPKLLLPSLRRIGFFDANRGWAVGCRSAMYPTGAFLTDDAGRSWRPVPGGVDAPWRTGDMLGPLAGAVAGRNRPLALLRGGMLESTDDDLDLRSVAQLRLMRPSFGWLVGDGGLVRATDDLFATRRDPPGELPKAMRRFDLAALAVRGRKCWMAGTPGSMVFHSPDGGRVWHVFPTGLSAPLRAIAFADDLHGWAVGELGTILATDDGGRSWRRQRAGGARVALLAIFAEPQDVPLELIVQLAEEDGFLTAVEVIGRRDIELPSRDDVPAEDRLHEAIVRLGGSATAAAWQFPLRQQGLRIGRSGIVAVWDNCHQRPGLEVLRERLVRSIRAWRPDAIVTHDAGASIDDPLGQIVREEVLRAVADADDENACPELSAATGLAPWRVRRVFGTMPSDARGGELSTARFSHPLGGTPAEAAAEPRGLLVEGCPASPTSWTLRPVVGDVPSESSVRSVFAGLPTVADGAPRREPRLPSPESGDIARRRAVRLRHVRAIAEQAEGGAWSADKLLAQIGQLTRDLDARDAGHILYQIADRFHRSGRWTQAAEAHKTLVRNYPDHPLAAPAIVWLVRYYASEEAAWRTAPDVSRLGERLETAVALGSQLERARFDLFAEPAVRFSLAAAHRGLDQPRQAERLYQLQHRGPGRDGWWDCAQAELRPAAARPAKPRMKCAKAAAKPRLDGRLDDDAWQSAEPVSLSSAQHDDGQWPASVKLAYDDEFLYVAIQCRDAPGMAKDYQTDAARPRDADLTGRDRVELFLDIDRD